MDQRTKVLDNKIRADKIAQDVGETAVRISALKSGDIDKYELLTQQEVIPRGAEASQAAAKFEYSPLGKAFGKQVKAIEEQREKQVTTIQGITPRLIPMETPGFVLGKNAQDVWQKTHEISEEMKKEGITFQLPGKSNVYSFGKYLTPVTLLNLLGTGKMSVREAMDSQKELVGEYQKICQW